MKLQVMNNISLGVTTRPQVIPSPQPPPTGK